MAQFSDDVDMVRYEPILFGELCFANQVLISGEGGTLSGTTFTVAGVDFEAAQVSDGCVIYLRSADGVIDGCYEIVSVDSATQLTVSVVRADSSVKMESSDITVGKADPTSQPAPNAQSVVKYDDWKSHWSKLSDWKRPW